MSCFHIQDWMIYLKLIIWSNMTYLYLKNLLFVAVAQFVQHEKEFPKPRNVERTTIQFHAFLYHII